MIQCQNCGQANAEASNFCRFCGTRFLQTQLSNRNDYDFSPPRPYVWKTDEFHISENQARNGKPIQQVQPLVNQFPAPEMPPRPQPFAFRQPQNMAYGFQCPSCGSRLFPKTARRISTAGWIVFAVLMVTFFPLFWIGLLIKEDVRLCSVCNMKIG